MRRSILPAVIDLQDGERDDDEFEIALLLEELDPAAVRDRALELRPCITPRRRVAITVLIARALSQSALTDDQRCDRFLAWHDGFGVKVANVVGG